MIINQINYKNQLNVTDATAISKDIAYSKTGYGVTGKIVGDAPITIDTTTDEQISLPVSDYWRSVCYGNGKFAATLVDPCPEF